MEPKFTVAASTSTVTPRLASQIETAIARLPAAHRIPPEDQEIVESPEAAFTRLQDWAFIHGFALVKESSRKNRVIFECIHHKTATKNSRKTLEANRERVETKTQARGCKFGLYVSKQKRFGDRWALGSSCLEHNHAPNPDPFEYLQHRNKRPGHFQAVELATSHRGTLSYSQSAEILRKDNLELDRKKYYNLQRKEGRGELTRQEELQLLLETLDNEGIHPRIRAEYELDGVERQRRVIRDIFWITPEQIRLARRFVSGFMYEIDSTFNTNRLRLPLSDIVGIDNIGKTFPVAFCYITSESAASFAWISEQLSEYVFYDCPEPAIIIGDFAKGLGAAVAAKAAADLARKEVVKNKSRQPNDSGFPEASAVHIENSNGEGEAHLVFLQLCEWHAVEAIKRRLTSAGRYKKKKREEVVDLVWKWVKAPDVESLEQCREDLFEALNPAEEAYIKNFYQPKEPQFCRAYTCTYRNLGVHTTQRNESYHVVVKQKLHKNLSIPRAIRAIVEATADIGHKYDKEINNNRRTLPRLLDRTAFTNVGHMLTHYALDIAMKEWSAAKRLADNIEDGKEELDFELFTDCTKGCAAPARFSIPCQHWLYPAAKNGTAIPLSLFHPRWLLDGPAVLHKPWKMLWNEDYSPQRQTEERYAGDRFANRGEDLIREAALAAIQKLKSLPAAQAETFASSFKKGTEKLATAQDKMSAALERMPLELPGPLKEGNLRQFPTSRKRAMTGREAAEEEERDLARQRRREEMNAAALTVADDAIEAQRREMEESVSVMAEYWFKTQNSNADSAGPDSFTSLNKLDSEEEEEGSEGEEEGSEGVEEGTEGEEKGSEGEEEDSEGEEEDGEGEEEDGEGEEEGSEEGNGERNEGYEKLEDSSEKLTGDNKPEEKNPSNTSCYNGDNNPRRSGRRRKITRRLASQLSQERALLQRKAEAKAKRETAKRREGKKPRKDKLKEVSQLLDDLDYTL
jgi:hypothetical protein